MLNTMPKGIGLRFGPGAPGAVGPSARWRLWRTGGIPSADCSNASGSVSFFTKMKGAGYVLGRGASCLWAEGFAIHIAGREARAGAGGLLLRHPGKAGIEAATGGDHAAQRRIEGAQFGKGGA